MLRMEQANDVLQGLISHCPALTWLLFDGPKQEKDVWDYVQQGLWDPEPSPLHFIL